MSLTLLMASGALAAASPIYLCIGEKAGQGVKSGGTTAPGTCPKVTEKQKVVYVPVALPKEAAEQEKLLAILPHMKYVESGVGGKPTVQFSGVNVQIVNGEGKTASVNGEGNLVIGYDEHQAGREQSGSHDMILGEEQLFTSFGGIVAGYSNAATGPYSSVSGGNGNTASGQYASVGGGGANHASGEGASVSGGEENTASGFDASVSGGFLNTASANFTSVSGGTGNAAEIAASSVTGGHENKANNVGSSVGGGQGNIANGRESWIGGGSKNVAAGELSSVFGGKEVKATKEYEAIP